jgi:hypothetical protein
VFVAQTGCEYSLAHYFRKTFITFMLFLTAPFGCLKVQRLSCSPELPRAHTKNSPVAVAKWAFIRWRFTVLHTPLVPTSRFSLWSHKFGERGIDLHLQRYLKDHCSCVEYAEISSSPDLEYFSSFELSHTPRISVWFHEIASLLWCLTGWSLKKANLSVNSVISSFELFHYKWTFIATTLLIMATWS